MKTTMGDNIYVVNEYRSGLICHGVDFGGKLERLKILSDGTELWKKNGASYAYPRSSGTGYSAVQYWHIKVVERRVYEEQNRTEYDIQILERVGAKEKKEFFKKHSEL